MAPYAPTRAPTMPTTKAGHAPTGRPTAALNGTYGSVLAVAADSSVELTWSPVRFAPLGPIGRDASVNAHESDVQMHSPLMGSQKGVEQFDETICGGRGWC